MKAWFIFRDGKLYGSPIGYTTLKGAQKSLVGCEDWHNLLNGRGTLFVEPTEYEKQWYKPYKNSWLFLREVWSRKVWQPYLKEHYNFEEKEFEVVFK